MNFKNNYNLTTEARELTEQSLIATASLDFRRSDSPVVVSVNEILQQIRPIAAYQDIFKLLFAKINDIYNVYLLFLRLGQT